MLYVLERYKHASLISGLLVDRGMKGVLLYSPFHPPHSMYVHMCVSVYPCVHLKTLSELVTLQTHFRRGELVSIKQHMTISNKGEFGGVLHVILNLINCSTGGDNNNNSIFIIRIHCGQLIHIFFLNFLYYHKKTFRTKNILYFGKHTVDSK